MYQLLYVSISVSCAILPNKTIDILLNKTGYSINALSKFVTLGIFYYRKNRFNEAIDHYLKIIEVSRRESELSVRCMIRV